MDASHESGAVSAARRATPGERSTGLCRAVRECCLIEKPRWGKLLPRKPAIGPCCYAPDITLLQRWLLRIGNNLTCVGYDICFVDGADAVPLGIKALDGTGDAWEVLEAVVQVLGHHLRIARLRLLHGLSDDAVRICRHDPPHALGRLVILGRVVGYELLGLRELQVLGRGSVVN